MPPSHFGQGETPLPVRYTRDESGSDTPEVPSVVLTVPLASLCTTLMTHEERLSKGNGLGNSSGGPNRQFASSPQEPAEPPQVRSPLQLAGGLPLSLMQWLPGPAPLLQSSLPVPLLATSVEPCTSR